MLQPRRQFLQYAALSAGFFTSTPAVVSGAANEKMNIGFAGVAGRGLNNLLALPRENVAALCDVDGANLATASQRWPQAKTYRDFREMATHQDLDAVMISTPLHTHAHAASAAMQAGLHVYLEKPLAHSIDESRLLAKLSLKHSNLRTQLGTQHYAKAGYRRAREIVLSGALGAITGAHCWTSRPIWPQGGTRPAQSQQPPAALDWDLWLGPAPHRRYHPAYLPMYWRGWWDFGGGALVDMAPHLLDVAFHTLRPTTAVRVTATTSPVNQEMAPAWSIVKFAFPARGALPAFHLTWYDGGKIPSRKITGVARPPANGLMLIGSKAKLFVPQKGGAPVFLPQNPADKPPATRLPEASGAPIVTHQEQWAHACKTGGATTNPFTTAAVLCEISQAGNLAIRSQAAVEWKPGQPVKKRKYRTGWELKTE